MMLKIVLLLGFSLQLLGDSEGQACSEQREALRVLRQVQKLLTDHEASYLRGMRTLSRRLNQLRGQLQRQEDKELVSLTNTSSLITRQAKCSTFQGVQHCSCDPGYVIQTGGLCQDIDECSLYHGKAGSKICVHECVNTPGSYQCVCPQGYLLDMQQNSCKDIDECVSNQSACSGGEQCVNLYGAFKCVRPECPKPKLNVTYVKISSHQCERIPCPLGSSSCLEAPHSISFHYISLQSQLPVPSILFTMTAPRSQGDSQRFTLTRGKGHRGLEVRQAGRHRGELILTKTVNGPAELQVDVEMAEMSPQGLLGKHIFTVTLFVSQYTF
ncbi:fibulin-7-like isoform X3 [Hyla sarda]|uniref:fibulin-7-like isoform X3 n=1 Tax=Hyla sarda TaxID=327740 RepID=UPI0024C3448B|nr:fibulin-7-like isoform X3 [Hyla sarda]